MYVHLKNEKTSEPSKISTQFDSDKQQANDLKANPADKTEAVNTDTPATPSTNESTGKAIAEMVASADISNGIIYIRGGINNLSVSDGSCYAQLTGPNSESIKKTTTLLQNPSSTDCKTISINSNELSKGQWRFTLNYSSNNAEGKTDVVTFTN
jgi:hypothetical protein